MRGESNYPGTCHQGAHQAAFQFPRTLTSFTILCVFTVISTGQATWTLLWKSSTGLKAKKRAVQASPSSYSVSSPKHLCITISLE